MKSIYLYGPPASGKTTLGKALAERLGRSFADLDAEIERDAGCSVAEIFAREGETAFRLRESAALRRVSASIVALGGGTLLNDENRTFCEENGSIICLESPPDEELSRRISAAEGTRPLGNRAAERADHYASFPNRIVSSFEVGPSLVVIGRGFVPAVVSEQSLVADETVSCLYRDAFSRPIVTIPSGEIHKTPSTIAALWSAFSAAGLGRRDRVVAVGGGVTGDLVGFAAATWMRGMDWINVPTTLLSMVDASTGGKTGCDLPEGKNLAGAFHPPRLVLVDCDFLKTLDPALLSAGRAEMIKHEAIAGQFFSQNPVGLPSPAEIAANLEVKAKIVRDDPFERTGQRMLLNCGHTVAHALEILTDFRLSHGEAVAIGCVEEAREAVRRGLAPANWPTAFAERFAAAGLPTEMPHGFNWSRLKPVMLGDKKKSGSIVHFALPCGWGDVRDVAIDLGDSVK